MHLGIQVLLLILILPFSSPAADSGLAENQIELCETDLKKVVQALGASTRPDKERTTGFFDTRTLDLYQRQFYVRVRKTDSKVKVTFKRNDPPLEIWNDSAMDCETDVHADYSKRACSYDVDLSLAEFAALKSNPLKWTKVFSSKDLAAYNLLSGNFSNFTRMEYLGEVPSYKWEISWGAEPLNLDVWLMPPHQEPLMELSVRSTVMDSPQEFPRLKRYLLRRSLKACEKSVGRTRTLLMYLTR